ncbi:hypothetical protein Sjap_021433 [Stephania japonica]|uniref:DYW domain-containing protein n=1 Tax=Stephania japonica TaxID=461633 RepID=A0AAP0EMF8_9MAGN
MDAHLLGAKTIFSYCGTSRTLHVCHFLYLSFQGCILIVLMFVPGYYVKVQILPMTERQRIVKLLRDCSRGLLLDQGRKVHAHAVKMGFSVDLIIHNDLIDMYGKCDELKMAHTIFDGMSEKNIVSWTSLMSSYVLQGDALASLSLFCQMGCSGIKPNEFTFSTNLKACGMIGIIKSGMQIHGLCSKTGFELVPIVANSIIDMYSKCGRVEEAAWLFENMPFRTLISWNIMFSVYNNGECGNEPFHLFQRMQEEEEIPDEYTFVSLMKACSVHGAICEGSQIHASLITRGLWISSRIILASSLVDLYVKCGQLADARKLFDEIALKNVICWTVMIVGYIQEGNLCDAMNLFDDFRKTEFQVDGFILSSLIGVIADFALLEQGKQFHSYILKLPSGLDISVANSVIDMYLKCGLLEEAKKCFDEMSNRSLVSWTVMIAGYGKYGYGEEAIWLFEQMELNMIYPDDVAYLAVLSACSHAGLIEECRHYFSILCVDNRIKPRVEHYACFVDLLGRGGYLEEAKNLIQSMPFEPTVEIWQTLLGACRVHRDLEMGREVGEILLRLDGDNHVNYVMLSNLYAEAGKWLECESIRKLMKCKGMKKEAGRSWIEIDKEVHFFYGGDDTHPLSEKIQKVLREMETRMKEKAGYANGVGFALHDIDEESKEDSLRVHSEKLAIGLALLCGKLEEFEVIRVFKNLRVCGDCHEFIKGLSKVLRKVFLVRDATRFHRFEDGICSCKDYW